MMQAMPQWSGCAVAAVILVVLAALPARAQDGLVAHWAFDDGSGPVAVDGSPSALDADVIGAKWVKGLFGTALWFDGQTSHVQAGQVPGLDGSDEMTISAWVYWEGGGRYPNIITGGQWSPGGFLVFVTDQNCQFRMGRPGHRAGDPNSQWGEGGASFISGFEAGRWYHLVASFKRPTIATYLDGKPVTKGTWDHPVGYSGDLVIGRWNAGSACHMGLIDDVRIYNRALAPDEIVALHQATSTGRDATGAQAYELLPEPEVKPIATFTTRDCALQVDELGRVISLIEKSTGRELLLDPTQMVAARVNGQSASRIRCRIDGNRLTFSFGRDGVSAAVRVEEKRDYLAFEVIEADESIESLSFLQLQLKPMPLRSAMSGAARDDQVGACLRALTIDTRVQVGGASPMLTATATREYGIVGTRAGLIVCAIDKLLPSLQALVNSENVPKSKLGGPWARHAEENRGSYLFSDVGEADVDDWIALANRGGFTTVHFSSWWKTLGHYEPSPRLFPNGMAGLKATVDRIHEAGLRAGMHTLTGCIQPTDEWVSPVPDPRLAADATYTLIEPMDETSDAIYVLEKPKRHDTIWSYAGAGNVIRIGNELIHYSTISYEEPYGFLKCTRGAFGTAVSAHEKGVKADHLLQRYIAFYPDERSTLVGEVADRIAQAYNECGFDQIYQDGAEGMGGWRSMEVMRTAIYERLKRPATVEASAWGHWSWYFHSRVGAWDHSKWGFRISQDLHCADLPFYRDASLLQAQLGWWAVNGPGPQYRAEMPEEMEYFCAKVMANDAPMSLQGIGRLGKPANARMLEYLTMTGWYERLRLARYFSDAVLNRLRKPGDDYHLRQAEDGRWELLPSEFATHVVTGLDDGTDAWLTQNSHAEQPPAVRITALWSVQPYDHVAAIVLADADAAGAFATGADAKGVKHTFGTGESTAPTGEPTLTFSATNTNDSAEGAWARAVRDFEPRVDMGSCEAIGVWVHGDGRGELLNIQLENPPEYSHALADHYVKVDFTGWRYFELLLRERDPDTWGEYTWPYSAGHAVLRTPLTRSQVNRMTIYLNNIPPGEAGCAISLGPIHALPTASAVLDNIELRVAERTLTVPRPIPSGSFIEIAPDGRWELFDSRCDLMERGALEGPLPALARGASHVALTSTSSRGDRGRAEVTFVTRGEALRNTRPAREIDRAYLRYEYVMPRLVTALDGQTNRFEVICRPGERATLGAEIILDSTGGGLAAYESPQALTLETFDDLGFFAEGGGNEFAKYVYDGQHKNISTKPGVTQELTQSTDTVRIGAASARYTATSTLPDRTGWSASGRRFAQTLDLSSYRGLGAWVHGDGGLAVLKFQLRDTAGGWCDMVRTIDFTGWRYLDFDFAGSNLDRSKVEYLIIYYNAIPGGATVTTYIDDIRALPSMGGVSNPSITVGSAKVTVQTTLSGGDRILYSGGKSCTVVRGVDQSRETVTVDGALPALEPGVTPVVFDLEGAGEDLRVQVCLVKDYGG